MADNFADVRAALQTISEAAPRSLISYVRELCQANAAIAEAFVVISQSSSYPIIKVEAEAERTVVSEETGISDLQTQDQRVNVVQDTHNMLGKHTSWRDRSEHAVVRLAQYWIQRKLAGSRLRTIGGADEHRLLVDLRKAALSSTPTVLAMLRGIKRKRSSDSF
jgi:hypothetical protein